MLKSGVRVMVWIRQVSPLQSIKQATDSEAQDENPDSQNSANSVKKSSFLLRGNPGGMGIRRLKAIPGGMSLTTQSLRPRAIAAS